jgi:DNA-binding ferritin-like protein
MHTLASFFRFLQQFAHVAHHMTFGCTFFEDHEFLGELYGEYEEAFDNVVERMVGLGKLTSVADRLKIDAKAADILSKTDAEDFTEAEDWFETLYDLEKELCNEIEKLAKGKVSQGTLNLLAQFADDSEKRQYKLGQRIKPDTDDADEGDDEEMKRAY